MKSATINRIKKANFYIEEAKKADILAIEPDSTWESEYQFTEIKVSENCFTIKYRDIHKKKNCSDRHYVTNPDSLSDAHWSLSWVVRCIKKGFKAEGIEVPKFNS